MQDLLTLYNELRGHAPQKTERLPGAGSNRAYYRLTDTDGSTLIGVVSDDTAENTAFLNLAAHFGKKGLPVPHVYAHSHNARAYLQQDLGSVSLFDVLRRGREAGGQYDAADEEIIERTMRCLPHFQVTGAEDLDDARLLAPRQWNGRSILYDLNYFKYCFLRTSDVAFDEEALQDDFERLARDLCTGSTQFFLYRDFQARNVMLVGGEPFFIDFQGGRRGPLQYDVASFLWQASAQYPAALRERMISAYLDELRTLTAVDETAFRDGLKRAVFFRVLQVLGAYGLRGRFERKAHFLRSIPPALRNMRALMAEGVADNYPELKSTLALLIRKSEEEAAEAEPETGGGGLTVRVNSFSYKKGIPDDPTGNGGGYVFDCRAPHNPGRYDAYKALTGMDEPVIRFLEEDGEILPFLDSVYRLADFHVARYIERGFTSLMFSFGCTGGQHRSVYSAEHLAKHIHEKYGVRVLVWHREQHVRYTLEAKK